MRGPPPVEGARAKGVDEPGDQAADRHWKAAWLLPPRARAPKFRTMSLSSERRLLAVFFTERGTDHIRIVSARLATPRERRTYEEDFR